MNTRRLPHALLLAAALALGACSTSRTDLTNTVSMPEYDGESVVVTDTGCEDLSRMSLELVVK